MKTKTTFTFLILFTLLFSACGGNDIAANANAKTALTNPPQDHVDTTPPTETPPPNPFSGLIYKDGSALWRIETDGQAVQISSCAPAGFGTALSPDGGQMLYSATDDIWTVDLTSCAEVNLTNTPDTMELNPQYWRSQPDRLIFGANPMMSAGVPGFVTFDGGEYGILDDSAGPNYPVALSPNSSYMAYLSSDGPLIYNFADGARIPFDVGYYGMDASSVVRMDSPTWSPDGAKLSWIATTQNGEDPESWRMNVIVFDLAAQTHTVIFSYIPVGRGGWPPPAVWSPDGQWLAFNAWVQEPLGDYGIWVVKADGGEQYMLRDMNTVTNEMLDQLDAPVWSPDGSMLAFSYAGESALHYYVEVGVWEVLPLSVPEAALLVDWR